MDTDIVMARPRGGVRRRTSIRRPKLLEGEFPGSKRDSVVVRCEKLRARRRGYEESRSRDDQLDYAKWHGVKSFDDADEYVNDSHSDSEEDARTAFHSTSTPLVDDSQVDGTFTLLFRSFSLS